jgi:hypothetical protein
MRGRAIVWYVVLGGAWLTLDAGLAEAKDQPPVSVADGRKAAAAFVEAVVKGDERAFNQLVDWDTLLERGMTGATVDDSKRTGFEVGAKFSLVGPSSLARSLHKSAQGGSVRVLRVETVGSECRALIRLLPGTGGVNYQTLHIARDKHGAPRVVDIYVFFQGELISDGIRRGYLSMANGSKPKDGEPAPGDERAKHNAELTKMGENLRAGKFAEVIDVFDSLPESLRQDKSVQLMRLQTAMRFHAGIFAQAMEEFRTLFPNDPCVDMLAVDYHTVKREFPQALDCLARLEKSVGPDPFLHVWRSRLWRAAGDLEQAHLEAEKAVQAEADLRDGYVELLELSLAQHDFTETERMLKLLTLQFQMRFKDLTTVPAFAEFVKSPEYEHWKAGQAKAP